jgi:hypothetical protein
MSEPVNTDWTGGYCCTVCGRMRRGDIHPATADLLSEPFTYRCPDCVDTETLTDDEEEE